MPNQSEIPDSARAGARQQRAAQLRDEMEVQKRQEQARAGARSGARAGTGQDQDYDESQEQGIGPVGEGEHLVKSGECISSLAKDTGHLWDTIWQDDANAELREVRQDPNVLLPGDRVHIPGIRPKQEPGKTEMRHRFVRRGMPEMLRIRVLCENVPRANQPYRLEIDGKTHTGVTDARGNIQRPIPPNARRGKLIVGEELDEDEYDLTLGDVDPITEISGVQGRLSNLGFDCGAVDGRLGPKAEQAIAEFQAKHRLEVTGRPDEAMRERLRSEHGS